MVNSAIIDLFPRRAAGTGEQDGELCTFDGSVVSAMWDGLSILSGSQEKKEGAARDGEQSRD